MKHQYEIRINDGSQSGEMTYAYGMNKNVHILISQQKATIRYAMTVRHDWKDLISFHNALIFRDAYRKVYLTHALRYDEGLAINKLSLTIDGETVDLGPKDPDFPYLFSMIPRKPLGLPPSWRQLTDRIIGVPKSNMDNDLRFSAMFSYLASKGKDYAIDRFTNLWTGMNAVYTLTAAEYEKQLRAGLGIPPDTDLKDAGIGKTESMAIGLLAWLTGGRYTKLSQDEIRELWDHYYDTEKCLQQIDTESLPELYEGSLKWMSGDPVPEMWQPLNACAERFGLPLYTYLLLIYPYHLRCDFFHGNRATMLLSAYNDYEIKILTAVNYFIDRYLADEIPKLFREEIWSKEKQARAVSYMRMMRKDFDKSVIKLQKSALTAKVGTK